MPKSLYARVDRGGKVTVGPVDLPESYGNVTGLRGLTDDQLAGYGWFPVVGRGNILTFKACEGVVLAHDDDTLEPRMSAGRSLVSIPNRLFDRPLESSVTGEHLLYRLQGIPLFTVLAATVLDRPVFMAVKDQHGYDRIVEHTPEQCRGILAEAVERLDDAIVLTAVARDRAIGAQGISELNQILNAAFSWAEGGER